MLETAQIKSILKEFRITKAAIFGSAARGEPNPHDIDILIEPSAEMGLFEFISLKDQLSAALHKDVDLVTYAGLHPVIREKVLKEAVDVM